VLSEILNGKKQNTQNGDLDQLFASRDRSERRTIEGLYLAAVEDHGGQVAAFERAYHQPVIERHDVPDVPHQQLRSLMLHSSVERRLIGRSAALGVARTALSGGRVGLRDGDVALSHLGGARA